MAAVVPKSWKPETFPYAFRFSQGDGIAPAENHWTISWPTVTFLYWWAPDCLRGHAYSSADFKYLSSMAWFYSPNSERHMLFYHDDDDLLFANSCFHFNVSFSPSVGSVCCSYAGHHTNCREYCQAIFRTDSSPGPSQIKAVENYCAAISPQLIHCVNNYTQSYPMRNPTDSK